MIRTIAAKELTLLYYSPLSWLLFALFSFSATWLFFIQIDQFVADQAQMLQSNAVYTVTDRLIAPFFDSIGVLASVFIPFLSMSMVSREYQAHTMTLLRAAPISAGQIILGKYAALCLYLLLLLALLTAMTLSLQVGTQLDAQKISACVFALALLMLTIAAIGLFFSTLSKQPVVAGLATLGFLFVLALFGWDSAEQQSVLAYFSLQNHYRALLTGLISTADIAYFVITTGLFLSWSIYKLASQAWPDHHRTDANGALQP